MPPVRLTGMDAVIQDFQGNATIPFAVMVARLLGAMFLAGIIGFEREMKHRPAGLRTHMIVALAAAVFGMLSIEVANAPVFGDVQVRADPIRVIEAVTAGVAFLAAGFIIVAGGRVKGVTTGAGIWLGAAIGLAVGLGYWTIALSSTLMAFVVLFLLRYFERLISAKE